METKHFKTIKEIEEFLKKHPEMKTGFINVGFEKKQGPVEGEVEKLEAMQEEIIAIQMELSEIKRKHPCIDSFEAKYTIGTGSRFDFWLEGDKFVSNIIIPRGDDGKGEDGYVCNSHTSPYCKTCANREQCFGSDFDIDKSLAGKFGWNPNPKAVKKLKSAIRKREMADKLRMYADWLEEELKENR